MTQASPTIGADKSGLDYRTEDNAGKTALLTHHKGSSAPSYAEAGMIWVDDTSTPWLMKFYDGADWIVMGAVSATDNTFKPYNGTAQTVNSFKKATIASATTTDLGTLAGNMAEVTGTTTITSFGSSASADRPLFYVRFAGALTLTHNGTSLILPGAANITTVAGDAGLFEYLGSGNWRCLFWYDNTGLPALKNVANEFTKAQNFNATTLTDAANISWDLANNQVTEVTLEGNRTLDNPTNMVAGATYILTVKQDATGSRTLAFDTAYKFPGGAAPSLSSDANSVDILTFVSDGTSMCGILQGNFS